MGAVRKSDLMPIWVRYYDDAGELARTMSFEDYRRMGGRLVPALMIIRPVDKPEEHTLLRYSDLAFDIGLEPSFFSLRRLRRDRN